MAWVGRKKIAFVPLSRPNAVPPDVIPPDWEDAILRRALYDPDPTTGRDRSQGFTHVFAGRDAAGQDRVYAVDPSGQLLSYGDAGTPGNVSDPVTVGFGGWQGFAPVFAGRDAAGHAASTQWSREHDRTAAVLNRRSSVVSRRAN